MLATALILGFITTKACEVDEVEVGLTITTDNWGYEVYWEIVPSGNDCGDGTIAWGGNDAVGCNGGGDQNQTPGGYANNATIEEGTWCLLIGESYDLVWVDDWGDGGADFELIFNGIVSEEYSGTNDGNTWTFTVTEPPALDAAMMDIESYSYVTQTYSNVSGTVANLGVDVMNAVELQFSVNGGSATSETFSGLNVESNETYNFEFGALMQLESGENEIEIEVVSVNGGTDEVPSNNSLTKDVVLGNPIPNVIDGYIGVDISTTVINAPSDGVDTPRDLDFHPILSDFELWVINKGTENSGGSTVRFENAGMLDQWSEYEEDGNAWHFMSLPTGISFGENENFATSPGVYDANHDGGTPFTGPTLWSSEDDIYAEPSGGNGSHLDMLHVSPNAQGITHEKDNVYWVVDGYNQDIVRYDFAEDHGPGNSYHGDAIIHRYADFSIEKDPGNHIVSHCVLDKNTNWLYVVDFGGQRVLRMDITTGILTNVPSFGPFEDIVDYRFVEDYTWEVIVSEGLIEPAGIDIVGNRLIVSDHANGDVVIYDVDNAFAELGRIETNEPGIMGIKIGPWGRVWYVNASTDEVGIIEGNALSVEDSLPVELNIYPNPATESVNVSYSGRTSAKNVSIVDVSGARVYSESIQGNSLSIDIRSLASGMYMLLLEGQNGVISSERLVVE